MYRSPKLLKSVQEMECQLCGRFGQTVPAHANWQQYGKGMGLKAHDCFIAAVCTACHDRIDGRKDRLTDEEKHDLWHQAWIRTLQSWFVRGVVIVK